MTVSRAIVVLDDANDVAEEAARRVAETASEAVAARGRFVFVLSGGSTPKALYARLASSPWRDTLPWDRTLIFFGDERCVPPDHPESNYAMAVETLLSKVPIPRRNVHRMKGELHDAAAGAAAYEAEMRGALGALEAPAFDFVLLGLGTDGHTASLFPGTAALAVADRWVAANFVPKLDAWRLTLTFPALAAARRIAFLVTGADKAAVAAEAFGDAPRLSSHPAGRVAAPRGRVEVLLDRMAGGVRSRIESE